MRKGEEKIAIPKMPKRFWEDLKWAREHHGELLKNYKNQWIAVVNKKVVSAGNDLCKIEEEAKWKTNKKFIATMFIDGGNLYGSY